MATRTIPILSDEYMYWLDMWDEGMAWAAEEMAQEAARFNPFKWKYESPRAEQLIVDEK